MPKTSPTRVNSRIPTDRTGRTWRPVQVAGTTWPAVSMHGQMKRNITTGTTPDSAPRRVTLPRSSGKQRPRLGVLRPFVLLDRSLMPSMVMPFTLFVSLPIPFPARIASGNKDATDAQANTTGPAMLLETTINTLGTMSVPRGHEHFLVIFWDLWQIHIHLHATTMLPA